MTTYIDQQFVDANIILINSVSNDVWFYVSSRNTVPRSIFDQMIIFLDEKYQF